MATMGIRDVAYSRPHGQQRKTRFNLALFYWAIHLGCLARFSVPLRLEPQCSQQAPNAACSEHMEFVVLDGSRSGQELKI